MMNDYKVLLSVVLIFSTTSVAMAQAGVSTILTRNLKDGLPMPLQPPLTSDGGKEDAIPFQGLPGVEEGPIPKIPMPLQPPWTSVGDKEDTRKSFRRIPEVEEGPIPKFPMRFPEFDGVKEDPIPKFPMPFQGLGRAFENPLTTIAMPFQGLGRAMENPLSKIVMPFQGLVSGRRSEVKEDSLPKVPGVTDLVQPWSDLFHISRGVGPCAIGSYYDIAANKCRSVLS